PWAVGALPLLCGLAIMHWQAQRELQNTSQATTRQVVEQVEHILDNISNAAKELLPLVGRPCDEIDLALRSQVTRNAFVRSTNLFHNNT
ncbi:CSS-motif domain-containing protein, partial [Metapseudomonas otitidis]